MTDMLPASVGGHLCDMHAVLRVSSCLLALAEGLSLVFRRVHQRHALGVTAMQCAGGEHKNSGKEGSPTSRRTESSAEVC